VLEGHGAVTNAVVFPGGYVGEGLELADVIVDRNRLISVRLGGAVDVADNFLLGSMGDRPLSRLFARVVARAASLVALLAAAPVLLLTALVLRLTRRGPVVSRREAVRLPAAPEEGAWRTFAVWGFRPFGEAPGDWERGLRGWGGLLLRFLPALTAVVRGDLALVGVPPRTPEE